MTKVKTQKWTKFKSLLDPSLFPRIIHKAFSVVLPGKVLDSATTERAGNLNFPHVDAYLIIHVMLQAQIVDGGTKWFYV